MPIRATQWFVAGASVLALAAWPGAYQPIGSAQVPVAASAPIVRAPATAPRSGNTVTVLLDGRGLLVGGRAERDGKLYWIPAAALFDPSIGRLAATGELIGLRENHRATRLNDGSVLVTGGMGPADDGSDTVVPLASAEIYDPATGQFKATGSMTRPRVRHDAELQPDGQVLVTGGETPLLKPLTSELFNPKTGRFTAVRR